MRFSYNHLREIALAYGNTMAVKGRQNYEVLIWIAKKYGLTNRQTNQLLRSKWPLEELDFMKQKGKRK